MVTVQLVQQPISLILPQWMLPVGSGDANSLEDENEKREEEQEESEGRQFDNLWEKIRHKRENREIINIKHFDVI